MGAVCRFAPSPTGDLHLGHAYAAIYAHDVAMRGTGRLIVRIEDLDAGRCRDEYVARQLDDLAWLGLNWEEPVVRQSMQRPLRHVAPSSQVTPSQGSTQTSSTQRSPGAHAAQAVGVQ